MANGLDEMSKDTILEEGRDVHVINKQLPVTVGIESTILEICIWAVPVIICGFVGYSTERTILTAAIGVVVGLVPGVIYSIAKVNAGNYLLQLEQKLQHDSSQIDNYQEQRVHILENAAKLLKIGVDLDKETFTKIAELRSGSRISDEERNEIASKVDAAAQSINVAFENYPDLKSHSEIEDVMQQNSYLQREVTAAREVYNDTVLAWNREIFSWPCKKIVAAKRGYTTRIPFIASAEIKNKSNGVFF